MVKNINARELEKILENENGKWEIIDVRENFEWKKGHIDGAKLIPMGLVVERKQKINWDKKVLFYCRSGRRSLEVANYFSQKGKNVWNLEGGIISL